MSPPPHSHSHSHSKGEITSNNINSNNASLCPHPLKINKDSHFIKKSQSSPSSPSSSSSSSSPRVMAAAAAAAAKPQQRQPVIIYTDSPKVIHTDPKDFMALVQKLTGHDGGDARRRQPKQEPGSSVKENSNDDENKVVSNEDNETTSSVITDDNNSGGSVGESQVSSCFIAPAILEPPLNAYVANLPVFKPSSAEFLFPNQPLLNYTDSLFFSHHNMMGSLPSSATLEGVNEFPEY